MKKWLLFSLLLVAAIAAGLSMLGEPREARGQVASSLAGWAWGGGEQEFSFRPTRTSAPASVRSGTGLGWISMSNANTGGGVPYGVTLPPSDRLLGSAWSENVGWIDFEPGGTPPGPLGQYAGVVRTNDNKLVGWARIRNIAQAAAGSTGGFEGWIHFNGSNYQVLVIPDTNPNSGQLSGFAWSNEFGWIDFSGVCWGRSCNVAPPVSIFANGQPTSITIPQGSAATITWCGTPASPAPCSGAFTSCAVSENGVPWHSGLSGQYSTGPLNDSATYGLSCTDAMGRHSAASVDVIVLANRPPITVTCSVQPRIAFIRSGVAARVTWTANVSPAHPPHNIPYTFQWNFTPAPDSTAQGGNQNITRYGTPGTKSATVTVSHPDRTPGIANCQAEVRQVTIIETNPR